MAPVFLDHQTCSKFALALVTYPPSPCGRLSRPRTTMGAPSPWGSRPAGDPAFPIGRRASVIGTKTCTEFVHPVIRFIRRKRAPGLKEVDMLIPIGVASQGSKPGGQHVHQPVVSRLRHPRLPVHPHRLPGRPDDLHHPPGARDLPLPRLRIAKGPVAWPRPAALPDRAHRPTRHPRRPAHPARRMPGLWRRAPGQGPLRRPAAQLHQRLRALCPGAVAPHDNPRRRQASRRRLGHDQGHPEARPLAPLCQAQAQAPAAHRH